MDIGSKTHYCRAFDWRGFELSHRAFKFSNTEVGFLTFLRWSEEMMQKTEMKKIIVADNVRQEFNWCWITGVLSNKDKAERSH